MAEGGETRSASMHRTPAQQRRASTKFASPEEKTKNRERKKARYALEVAGRVRPNDGKEVDHKKPLRAGGSNAKSNLRVTSTSANRSHTAGQNQHTKRGR